MSDRNPQPTAEDLARILEPSWRRYGRRRPSLFVLTDYMDRTRDGYEATLRRAFERRCLELGIRLVVVVGAALVSEKGVHEPFTKIFDYVGPDAADGVILMSSGLSAQTGGHALLRLVERMGGIPVCSLGQPIPGYPCVLCDDRAGISAAVEHLVGIHRRSHPLYLDGITANPISILRHEICREVLSRHGLPLKFGAVAPGQLENRRTNDEVGALLVSNSTVDAVIAANDTVALDTLEILRRGGRAPGVGLSIVGFDDMQTGRCTEPAITTIRQPIAEMARAAVDAVAAQWLGHPVPTAKLVASEFTVRKSCGCRGYLPIPEYDSASSVSGARQFFDERQELLCAQLQGMLRRESIEVPFDIRNLVTAFRDELCDTPGALETRVQDCLDQLRTRRISSEILRPLLTFVLASMPTSMTLPLEPTWSYLLSSIAATSAQAQLEQRLEVEDMYFSLIDVSHKIISALDFDSLVQVLAATIPQLVQRRVFVGLLTVSNGDTLETLLNSEGANSDQPLAMRTLAMRRFMPDSMYNSDECRTIFVLPISNEAELLGHVAIEALDQIFDYQLLRDHIGTSLRVITLHSEVLNQVTLRERSVQERLATAERMRTLSVLSGGVAHDLNNALGSLVALTDVVIGELDIVRRGHPDIHLEDAQQDLLTIKSGATRAAETVKDLMTLGRRGNVPPRPVDLARLLRAVADDLKLQLGGNQLMRLQLELPEVVGRECILVNEVKMVRAIGNLVRNAIDATNEDGRVLLRADRQILRQPQPGHELIPTGDYVTISVADNGCGIPANQLSHIFEPFFSTKYGDVKSGSGLGLTIVHGTVKEHDGFIDVVSRAGIGTTFVIYLPRSELSPEQHNSEPARARSKARILVVDDDPTQLRTARRVLQTAGYEVVTNSSGTAALELVRGRFATVEPGKTPAFPRSPFDVIMLDMALNEQFTGLEILQQIRQILPRQAAIIASGHGQLLDEMNTPIEDLVWLPKPYTANALAKAINQLISNRAT